MPAQVAEQQAPAAEWIATSDLKPWDRNPRRNDAAVEKVADSIRRFGFGSPIVARKADKRVIAGHTRLKAAKLLGLKTVPVRLLDVDDRQADLLALADNKLGEIAEWDDAMLGKMLSDLSFKDAALAGWGWKELGELANDSLDAALSNAPKLGNGLTYSLVVECESEDQQAELLDRFESEGLRCKPLVT